MMPRDHSVFPNNISSPLRNEFFSSENISYRYTKLAAIKTLHKFRKFYTYQMHLQTREITHL